jgi:hypothetical protein
MTAPAGSPTLTINFDATTAAPTCGSVSSVAGCTNYTSLPSVGAVGTATDGLLFDAVRQAGDSLQFRLDVRHRRSRIENVPLRSLGVDPPVADDR